MGVLCSVCECVFVLPHSTGCCGMVGGLLASEWHGLIACNIIGSLAAGNDHTCNFVHSIVGRAPGVREPRGGMQARHWRSETLGMLSCHTVGPTLR